MKKLADLRFMKDGVVFGPTDREGLEKLLAAGRITTDDRVSVRNAAWMRIGDYLAAPPSLEASAAGSIAPSASKKGDLRVLAAGRVVSALHRDDVERMWKAARVKDDDLICALGGPWMRVGDFFAPPPPAPVAPTAPAPIAKRPAPMPIPIPVPAAAKAMPPAPVPQPADGDRLGAAPPPTPVSDEWFVRVRGVHSAPLKKHHVEALFQAREITLDNVARHPTWPDNDWRPIRSIADLADISRL